MGLTNAALTAVLAVILAALGRLTLVTALVVLGIRTSLAAFIVRCALLPRDCGNWGARLGSPARRGTGARAGRALALVGAQRGAGRATRSPAGEPLARRGRDRDVCAGA
ncbi:MAG: hypothetical protein U0232_13575 [Thermomicrobiales bacterium]